MTTVHSIVTEMANIGPKMSGKMKGYDDMENIIDEDDRPKKSFSVNSLANIQTILSEKLKPLRRGTVALLMIILCLAVLSVSLTIAFVISANRVPVTVKEVASFGCASSFCMKRAAEVEEALDRSATPCDDFFQYSCGGWQAKTRIPPGESEITVRLALEAQIRDKLTDFLESPVERNFTDSSERKVKLLFKSCLNDYEKTRQGSNPLLEIFEEAISELYVFNDNISHWQYQSAIEKAQSDYRVKAFVKIEVKEDDTGKKAIQITRDGLTMNSYLFTYGTDKFRNDFKKFLKNVATLLVRDANISVADDVKTSRINTFVDDVFTFEYGLSNITRTAPFDPDFHEDDERVTLQQLNTQSGNFINWVSFFQYMFGAGAINSETKVMVISQSYIRQLGSYVNNLGPNKARILNNYVVWRVAYEYLQDLSWEYVHANREFYVDRTGRTEFLGTWRYCFRYVSRNMDIALSHLFIKDHFADDNKNKVHQIADYVKRSLVDHMNSFKWMDDKTRTYAGNKVQGIVDKLGYPEFIMNSDKVDAIYSSLAIQEDDYFQNVLNLNLFQKTFLKDEMKAGVNRSKWYGTTFASFASYFGPWNEVLVPAGILQWPFYDYHIPHYLNFGSMGTTIARQYLNSIDMAYGALYTIEGTQPRAADGTPQSWWSPETINQYNISKNCFVKALQNKTTSHFGRKLQVKASQANAAATALEVGSLKQAFYGYKKWENDNNGEPVAPGLGLNNDQMFFLSYAQTWCYTRRDILSYYFNYLGRLQEDHKVNQALSQMKEFSDAFKCPVNTPMNPDNKCSLW